MPQLDLSFLGHGGDYNPDQWLHIPGTFEEDIRLMKLSKCNLMSVGIFSWSALEPEEGKYEFGWLKHVLDELYKNDIYVFLATPSGARPAWMSVKYPEVLRVDETGTRHKHGGRHNHCFTSPVYREKVTLINTALAEAFGNYPAVKGWHISNEYSGNCHCDYCVDAFRRYLKDKFVTLDALNQAWWTTFWAHTYTAWEQIDPPSRIGETSVHGLTLEWNRFTTYQTVDFMKVEIAPIRRITPNLPVTANFMEKFIGLDYFKFAQVLDFVSWDSYPRWGCFNDDDTAMEHALTHDTMRSILKRPFALMESTPSMTNWQEVSKPKRPGMHLLSCMHALSHGADTVQYFQWRKSRGSAEKFHGAVVDHVGNENTRVFRDVATVGNWLEKLQPIVGTKTDAQTAVIFDWDNRWAQYAAAGPRQDKQHDQIVVEHYSALSKQGVNIDVIDSEQSFEGYKLIVAPMLYMVKPGVAERLEAFVANGGTLIATYWSGIVDENDLCFLGGFPGPLRKVLGIWSEEIDSLTNSDRNSIAMLDGNDLNMKNEYECYFLCDQIHAETAKPLAVYGSDFYRGNPALTVNNFGSGKAYYIAARTKRAFLEELYAKLTLEAGVERLTAEPTALKEGVQLKSRYDVDGTKYVFAMNFAKEDRTVALQTASVDMITGESVPETFVLPSYGVKVLKQK